MIVLEFLVTKSSDVLWWDEFLIQTQDPLSELLPKFKQIFESGNDLVTIKTTNVDHNTRLIEIHSVGATENNVEDLWLWQAYRHQDLRPLLEFRSKYRTNYSSQVGPTIKRQTQS